MRRHLRSTARSMKLVAVLAVGTVLVVSSCTASRGERPTRYVGDLIGLVRAKSSPFDELYLRPGVKWEVLHSVRIARVELSKPLDTRDKHYTERELERVRRSFELKLGQGLERGFPIAAHDGKGVVRIEATLTEVVSNVPPLSSRRSGHSIGLGMAGMQLSVRDSRSGKVLVAIVDRYNGENLRTNPAASFTWGDAGVAFRLWARQLRELLERQRERAL
jgi:hypothetical protein